MPPNKTRELHNHHFDSTIWNEFQFRDDDIVIATYAKSGTTWMQQIVGQLIFDGAEGIDIAGLSLWLDLRVPAREIKLEALEAQDHRRFIKTHLPADALVFSPQARYIYIGRDGRDVAWSLHNHHMGANETWYELLNDTPGLVGPPIGQPNPDIRAYFMEWLERDGYPFWSLWDNLRTWWAIRDEPNVLMVHFARLKADMPGEIRRIAEFLDIEINPSSWEAILEHCSFGYMKAHAELSAPMGGALWEGGAQTFMHKGTNGRWVDVLTAEDVARYEQMAKHELGEDCARWLATGEL